MATVATNSSRKRSRFKRAPLIITAVVLIALIGGAVLWFQRGANQVAPGLPTGWQVVIANTGAIDSTVSATGNIEPQAQADLRFAVTGTVTEILVQAGDAVSSGQPLARVDTTDLRLQVDQSEADLKEAQASYIDQTNGATKEEIAEARARVAQAQSQYQQTASSVGSADIDAARADLEQAQARLARLQSGVAPEDKASSDQQLQQAESNLNQARVELATAKERARLDMETQANALRDAQDDYSRTYWDNRNQERQLGQYGKELPQENKDQEAAALRKVQDGEVALEQARNAYEQAKQNEINTLKTREADLASARTDREKVLAGPRQEEMAEARAAVQRAQAKLNQLTGANRASELAAQRANVNIAQAGLEQLMADPSTGALAKAEAAVTRAEVNLKQAQRNLEQATLTAPFAGTVSRVDMRVGENSGEQSIIALADLTSLHVQLPVDELDVAQLQRGQTSRIAIDALPGRDITGKVTNIAPTATKNEQGTTNYEVTVTLDSADATVKPGMTAVVQIVTSQKDNAVLLPRRAVVLEGGKSYVLIPREGQPSTTPGEPASERREVTLGLTNSESVEIVSGLQAGEQVLVQDVVSTFNPAQ